jgi:hypothetical protein
MSKRLIMLLVLAFVVGITAAYAEVQNVKVSGDITVMGVARDNFDLRKIEEHPKFDTNAFFGKERDWLSITRVRVDADLTDNVSTSVRLLNERNWNGESRESGDANFNAAQNITSTTTDQEKISLDLAYVTLKEFLYSPLTLKIGRQELRFGNGLIVGDPDTNIISWPTALAEADLSARKSFDALRATLDYNPLVIDAIYAKVEERSGNTKDDVTLSGINLGYDMGRSTLLEGYFFSKIRGQDAAAVYNVDAGNNTSFDRDLPGSAEVKQKPDRVFTIGARGVNKSLKNLTVGLEGAFQFGTYNPRFDPDAAYRAFTNTTKRAGTGDRRAWALQLDVAYDLKDIAQVAKYSPVISGNYTYLSGADRDRISDSKYRGWDPMFEDQTYGHIMNAIFGNTNMHRGALSAKAKLTDDIGLKLDYVMAWLAQRYPEGRLATLSGVGVTTAFSTTTARTFRMGGKKTLGQEIDATITYDYTEDVQFALLGGVYLPTSNINTGKRTDTTGAITGEEYTRASAAELIGSMKVTF